MYVDCPLATSGYLLQTDSLTYPVTMQAEYEPNLAVACTLLTFHVALKKLLFLFPRNFGISTALAALE